MRSARGATAIQRAGKTLPDVHGSGGFRDVTTERLFMPTG